MENYILEIDNPRKRSNVDISKSAPVIGIVVHRSQELFTIDIGTSVPCSLPSAAFEGSTKRNLPNLHVGDLVYAKIHSNIPETEIVLTCINKNQKADGLGKLDNEGLIFQMPQSAINIISKRKCEVWKILGSYLKYESAVGANGYVWIRCESLKDTMILMNLLLAFSELKDESLFRKILKEIF